MASEVTLLPEPDSPTSASVLPGAMLKLRPWTTVLRLKEMLRSRTEMTGFCSIKRRPSAGGRWHRAGRRRSG